jgi:GTP cyclohydrolase III
MVKACILVCCKLLKTKKIVDLAKKQPGVKNAFPVHGRWDIAVATEELDLKDIARIGMTIYKAEGVEIVETLVGYPEM